MLPRAQRLSSTEFARVFEESRVLRHPLLQLRVLKRKEGEEHSPLRAAFVAPKKLGKAVLRNRLRRRVRERYRLLQTKLWQAPHALTHVLDGLEGCDLIWVIGSEARHSSVEELDNALRELLSRAVRFVEKTS